MPTTAEQSYKDGCTSVPDLYWRKCCDEHDKNYEEKRITRAEADIAFLRCMRANAKTPIGRFLIAPAYYFGVRIFGGFYWKDSDRIKPVVAAESGDIVGSNDLSNQGRESVHEIGNLPRDSR